MKTTITALCNQKGGVGKTTSCLNLGVRLAQEGKKVLLVDCDSQGSLTISTGCAQPDSLQDTLSTAMLAKMMDTPYDVSRAILRHGEGVDILPANIELSGVEVTMVDNRTNYAKKISGIIREAYGHRLRIFNTEIPRSVRAEEMSAEGKSIFAHDPKGKVAAAYRELTKEVCAIERKKQHQLEAAR